MSKAKRPRLKRHSVELKCEFSECTDICFGMDSFSGHVREHVRVMTDQLKSFHADGERQETEGQDERDLSEAAGRC